MARTIGLFEILGCVFATAAGTFAAVEAESTKSRSLKELDREVAFTVRGTPAATRTIADVEVLSDGRVAVLDFDTRRVAVFSGAGRFQTFLEPPRGISPESTLIPRLAARLDGGLVLVDNEGDRFLFYDNRLQPEAVVPFGVEIGGVNGFVRLSSGEMFVAGYSRAEDKILHRFRAQGGYIASYIGAVDLPFPERAAYNTGLIAVDPADETLWVTRLTPYEILHVSQEGQMLGRISREPLGGFSPPVAEPVGDSLLRLRGDFSSSVKIAVVGDLVVNSYVLENGKRLADVFQRDGTLVEAELTQDSPLAFAKRVRDGVFVRHFNGQEPRVEVWKER
ncbi:MAG: hypothetical protein ACRD88_06410 [Terriglobia bacterium]